MLRINLLPDYVSERRLIRRLIVGFTLLFILCVGLPLAAYFHLKSQLSEITQKAADAVAGKQKTDALKAQRDATLAKVDPIKAKLQFVTDINDYTKSWVRLYNTLADTSPKSSFIYTDAAVSGTTMTIKAYSPSVEEVGRYLQAMYREPDFKTVAVDKVPGYPDNVRHLYYLNGVLVFADGATNSGSSTGGGGAPPGGGGQAGGGGGANYTPANLAPNGPGNLPAGVGPPPPELTGGVSANGQTGGAPTPNGANGGAASGGYSDKFLAIAGRDISPFAPPDIRDKILQQALRRVVVRTVPKGFDITVTATLNQAFTPPALPGTAPAAGAASPFGGPGGGNGGMTGGPPG